MKACMFLVGLLLCINCVQGAQLIGGPTSFTKEDYPLIEKAAQFAVGYINELKSPFDSHLSVLEKIVKGTKQLVAGTRYKLWLKIGEAKDCRNTKPYYHRAVTTKECPVDENTVGLWMVDVWEHLPSDPQHYELLDLKKLH